MSNHYEDKQARRKERLQRASERAKAESQRRLEASRAATAGIPFGQPILVGHHSEGRHRRALERSWNNLGKGVEAQKRSEYLANRAASVGTGGISSDDPEAVVKLRAELARCEAQQAHMLAVNKAHKQFLKDPATLDKSTLGDADKVLVRGYKPAYSWEPHPYAPYQLSNNNANIRRIAKRIEQLSQRQEAGAASSGESKETECKGYRVVENFADNRLQVFFDKKPPKEVCRLMRHNGFVFSRSAGNAWQRKPNAYSLQLLTVGPLRQELESKIE